MADYCTPADIARFLFRNTQGFDVNTLLSAADVTTIIRRKMDLCDRKTKRTWQSIAVVDELCDITFSDKWRWHGDYVGTFTVQRRPVSTVSKIEVVQGGEYVDITAAGPDRKNGWYNDPATGEFFIVGTDLPGTNRRSVRVSYTYGEVTPPGTVVDACIRYVSAEIMQSENFSVMLPEDSAVGGTIDSKAKSWVKEADDYLSLETDPVVVTEG